MPRPRFQRAAPELQQAILAAAITEFGQYGYAEASLNRILLAAGLSKGAFYYYFDDKADLAAAVLDRELCRMRLDEVDLGKSAADYWAALERYMWRGLEQLRDDPATRDVITRLGAAIHKDPALQERLGPVMAGTQQRLHAIWQHGQSVGAVRTDLPATALVAIAQAAKASLGTAMLPADRGATVEELEAFTHVYLDLVRRMTEPRR